MASRANRNSDVDDPVRLEAEIRAAMFHHSQVDSRGGFESQRERERIHAEIDELLDRRRVSLELQAIARVSKK